MLYLPQFDQSIVTTVKFYIKKGGSKYEAKNYKPQWL